jgi:hypothetical protein
MGIAWADDTSARPAFAMKAVVMSFVMVVSPGFGMRNAEGIERCPGKT